MRLIHRFPLSMPVDWPDDYQQQITLLDDGDMSVLHVEYSDKHFVVPATESDLPAYVEYSKSQGWYQKARTEGDG